MVIRPVTNVRSLAEYVNPTEKQQSFLDSMWKKRFLLYGGARGGGKSYILRWALVKFLVDLFKTRQMTNVEVGLFCETYPELQDRQMSKIQTEFPEELGVLKTTQAHGLGFYLHEHLGSGIIKLRNLDKPSKYQSAEFAAIAVDELTKTTNKTFDILRGSMRWPNLNHTLFMGATNPGGIGHLWVKELWVDGVIPPEYQKIRDQFKFIQSLPSDNPNLTEQYWDDLNSIRDPLLRAAWVGGNWDVFAGMAFPGFSKDRHVIPYDQEFTIPDHWPIWRGIDWGYTNPFWCGWATKDPDTDRVYVFQEVSGTQMTEKQQCELIKDSTSVYHEDRIKLNYGDPAMWAKKTDEDSVFSSADLYKKNGVKLTRADNNRIQGRLKVANRLANLPDGKPGLQIFESCRYLVRVLPTLQLDETNVEDVDTDSDDHPYDGLRYLLTNVDRQKQKREPVEAQPSPLEILADRGSVI